MDLATQYAVKMQHDAATVVKKIEQEYKIAIENDLSGFTDAEIEREYGRRYERGEAASSQAMYYDEDRPF